MFRYSGYVISTNPLTIHENWEPHRWREDSIYLQKYHNLVVPIERQESFKALDIEKQSKLLDEIWKKNKK